jgi:hypothetical protein
LIKKLKKKTSSKEKKKKLLLCKISYEEDEKISYKLEENICKPHI